MRPDLDPSLMTPDERRREVAAILAVGLRRLRDRDADGNGSLEERLWVQQDANFNVTALLDNNGNVVERYAYDPFGNFTVYDATWTVRTGGSAYAWTVLHQGLHYDATVTLYYNRFRWYDADLGRFVTNDPKGFAAGDVDLYRYVGNGPTGAVDPSGLDEDPVPGTPEWLWKFGEKPGWRSGDSIPQENRDWFDQVLDDAPGLMIRGAFEVGSVIIPVPGGKLVTSAIMRGFRLVKGPGGRAIVGFARACGKRLTNKEIAHLGKDLIEDIASMMRGRFSGRVPSPSELLTFQRNLSQKHSCDLVVSKAGNPAHLILQKGEAASFRVLTDGRRVIVIGENATSYEILHEWLHMKHFERVGRDAWKTLSRTEKEQFVYDRMKAHYWDKLTKEQRDDAIKQCKRWGGVTD